MRGRRDVARPPGGCRSGRWRDRASAALLDLVEDVGLEAVGLAMDAGCGLAVGGVHEAEDLALGLVDPVLAVVDAVLALDPEVRLVRTGHIGRLDPREVVHIHVRRHAGTVSFNGLVDPRARRVGGSSAWGYAAGRGGGCAITVVFSSRHGHTSKVPRRSTSP